MLEKPPEVSAHAPAQPGRLRTVVTSRLANPTRDWMLAPRRWGMAVGVMTFVVSCLSLGALYWLGRDALQENVRDELRQLAVAASAVVDMTAHEQLTDKSQMGSPEHLKTLAPLVAFHKDFPQIKYLYTIRVRDGKQSFVLDTWFDPAIAARGPGALSPIGEPYASDSPAEDRLTLEAINQGKPYASENVFTDEYGAFISGSAPLHDAAGQVVGYVGMDLTMDDFYADMRPIAVALLVGLVVAATLSIGTGMSVTSYLRQRQKTRATESAHEMLVARVLESLNDGMVVLRRVRDDRGRETFAFEVVQANPAAGRIAGLSPAQLKGRPLRDALPGLGDPRLEEACARVARNGVIFQEERQVVRPDWKGWLQVTMVKVDERVVLALADISARKQHEEELELSRAHAITTERAKSQFLANLSHEVRTPLNAILGMSHLLQGTHLSQEQMEYLTAIHESGDALLSVINDVLDYSKIEAQAVQIEKTAFDPRNFLHRLQDQFAPLAKCKGLEFVCELSPELPRQVVSDPARLRQVVMNILTNALKFTELGQIALRASVDAASRSWRIEVTDTGTGISPEMHEEIFKPFTQGDPSTTRRYGGTGLGLAICSRLVKLLGGRIELASQPGLGSTFTICLPL